jgi:hypothetical protein
MGVTLDNVAGLPAGALAALEGEVSRHDSLVDAIAWSAALESGRTMAGAVAAVVVQDEYTHDVVIRWREGFALAYDTT